MGRLVGRRGDRQADGRWVLAVVMLDVDDAPPPDLDKG
jgi:hypothetical protein